MGKNNKARRAAKAKARAKARARWGAGGAAGPSGAGSEAFSWSGPEWSPPEEPVFDDATVAAVTWRMAADRRGEPAADQFVQRLLRMSRSTLCRAAESLFLEHLEVLWSAGWQPAELRRQGVIGCSSAPAGRLTSVVIAADHARRPARTLDSRWLAQVESLHLPAVSGRTGWLAGWSLDEALDRPRLIEVVLDALANLLRLPRLEQLIPPPGSSGVSGSAGRPRGAQADPLLERIRNLLAKAESTTFESEATAFTAKAQELMTRHAVDAALLEGVGPAAHEPVEARLPVDPPYVDAKSLLLQTVAEAGRCRAVYLPGVAMSSVVGYGDDLAGVELLFTSLLVQAQHALAEAARHAAPGTRTRSQSYRSAFLVSFSRRIGERLREINDAVLAGAAAEHGDRFLPVLGSRSDALDAYMAERYGRTVSSPVRGGYDAAGWVGGRLAAESARLSSGELAHEA
jgi:hypothetical protein